MLRDKLSHLLGYRRKERFRERWKLSELSGNFGVIGQLRGKKLQAKQHGAE